MPTGPRFAELPAEAKFTVMKFGAKWCHVCVTYKNRRSLERLKERRGALVTIKEVDVDKEEAKADAYGIRSLPVTVIEDEQGHELARGSGALSVDELDTLLAKATRKWKPKGSKKAKAADDADADDSEDDDDDLDDDLEDEDDDGAE